MKSINSFYHLESWLVRRLRRSNEHTNSGALLLRLSVTGVTLSLLVMLISVAVSLGFKRQVSAFAYSQTGHLSLYTSGGDWLNNSQPFTLTKGLKNIITKDPNVRRLHSIVQQRAMLKTQDDYAGILLFGLDSADVHTYYQERMLSGTYPTFSSLDTVHNPIVLPSRLSERMHCTVGDRVHLYFLHSGIKVRSFSVVGIYDSSGLDELPALCTNSALRALDKLAPSAYHRVAIELHEAEKAESTLERIAQSIEVNHTVLDGQSLALTQAEQMMPDIFSWLNLLDSNVYVLIGLMLLVSGFTMIAGLLIIVLDKTQHIGVLKALGGSNAQVRGIFTLLAMSLVGRALLLGNAIFGVLYYVQNTWHILELNPENYYIQFVPLELEPWHWIALNTLTVAVVFIVLLLPSRIVARICPADAMRFD